MEKIIKRLGAKLIILHSSILFLIIVIIFLTFYFFYFQYFEALDDQVCICNNLHRVQSKNIDLNEVKPDELSYVATLFHRHMYKNKTYTYRHICTGTIVNSRFILTSASCLQINFGKDYHKNFEISSFFVGAGLDHNLDKIFRREANYRKVIAYHFYNDKIEASKKLAIDDIALVEVESPFEFGERTGIYPVCLVNEKLNQFDGYFIAVGYPKEKIENFQNAQLSITESPYGNPINSQPNYNILLNSRPETLLNSRIQVANLTTDFDLYSTSSRPNSSISINISEISVTSPSSSSQITTLTTESELNSTSDQPTSNVSINISQIFSTSPTSRTHITTSATESEFNSTIGKQNSNISMNISQISKSSPSSSTQVTTLTRKSEKPMKKSKLLWLTLRKINYRKCVLKNGYCLSNELTDICYADYGSPVLYFYKWKKLIYDIGIIHTIKPSLDNKKCGPGLEVQATNIYLYLSWIRSKVNSEMCIVDFFRENFSEYVSVLCIPVLLLVVLTYILFNSKSEKKPVKKGGKPIQTIGQENEPKYTLEPDASEDLQLDSDGNLGVLFTRRSSKSIEEESNKMNSKAENGAHTSRLMPNQYTQDTISVKQDLSPEVEKLIKSDCILKSAPEILHDSVKLISDPKTNVGSSVSLHGSTTSTESSPISEKSAVFDNKPELAKKHTKNLQVKKIASNVVHSNHTNESQESFKSHKT